VRPKITLITGACGEVGTALVERLAKNGAGNLLTLDIRPLPPELDGMSTHLVGDILDRDLFEQLAAEYEIERIFHLAALLSTRAELNPEAAHRVNVDGTLLLLQLAADQSAWRARAVPFIFPSSIAVYGLPDLETKRRHARVSEEEWNAPTTMYGCNKLYGERLGVYYASRYGQLNAEIPARIDFRSVRYPGLISAFSVPAGGTSDYASEMIHAAAQGRAYACFVQPGLTIPFMAMPDAVEAVLQISAAPVETLTRRVYNIGAFSLSAGEIHDLVCAAFPQAEIRFEPDVKRQGIAESWPIDVDDSAARRDWGWKPGYDAQRAFNEYLIPNIVKRYQA